MVKLSSLAHNFSTFSLIWLQLAISQMRNFMAEFQTLLNFENFGLMMRKRWQKTKKVNIRVT
jgi:hypothetical protein